MDIDELVLQAKQGKAEAFGQLYDLFAQRIFKYIRIKIQDRQQAEDILQDIFIKAYKGLPVLRTDHLNFPAWLYKIAANTVNDHFRKTYRAPTVIGMDEEFDIAGNYSVEREIQSLSDGESMQKAFTQLPPLYKQVLELRFLQEFSLSEVAKILGKSNLAVRLIQFRALKKVRLILNNDL